jgi:nicotinamide-nucleotide amidase
MTSDLERAAKQVVEFAKGRSLTLATAESCTAGALVHLLTEAPGAADIVHGGFVAYTKDNKACALGVPRSLLAEHTAVSAPVAMAMAQGALERSPADVAVSITGVAGPDPDEDGNPVGLVYVSAVHRDGRSQVREHRFGKKPKAAICEAAMRSAITLVEEMLGDYQVDKPKC